MTAHSHAHRHGPLPRAILAITAAACGVLAASAPAQDPRLEGPPRVLRTFTHHQVTAVDRGISGLRPILSDSGNRIVFGLNPAADGQPYRLAAAGFEGEALAVLDDDPGNGLLDITADGSRVVYVVGSEVRSVAADGSDRRALFKPYGGQIDCVRISGNGNVVVFLASRGLVLRNGEQYQEGLRGVYAVDPDGRNLRRVAGPEEVARLRGVTANEVGNPNFTLGYPAGAIDVSTDGSRVVFGCWIPDKHVLFGCGIDGSGLRTIAEFPVAPGGPPKQFNAIALSGDGTTIAFQAVYPNELGVVAFDGGPVRVLQKSGPEDRRLGWGSSVPVYVTLDGARVTYEGRTYDRDGGGVVQLMSTHQEFILRYFEYEQVAPDGAARRFAYRSYGPAPYQLATMELNVSFERLRGAPRITDLVVDPPAIPRQVRDVVIALPLLSARVASEPPSPSVSSSGFRGGILDDTMAQSGRVGQTDLYDDGAGDGQTTSGGGGSGDAVAKDGVYSLRWLQVYADAQGGPRTVRVEAQVALADGRRRASIVEIGPYPVVPGSADRPPPGGTPPIDGRPPEPPSVNPRPPVAGPGGPGEPGGGGPGGNPGGGGPGGPPGGGGGGGAIDLTGFWVSESGALHFVRQIGNRVYWSVDFLPRVRNVYEGTIDGAVLTGTWVDLPGGEIETGTGTLVLRIESNDRLTKISDAPAYDASVWTRTGRPGTSGGPGGTAGGGGIGAGEPGVGLPPGGPSVPPPGATPEPWQTPSGRALIDRWAAEAMARVNAYNGSPEFNRRKPFSINKYGLLAGTGLSSAAAPEGFAARGSDRYWYMWDIWIPFPSGWSYPEWNAAGVPPLRDFVRQELAAGR